MCLRLPWPGEPEADGQQRAANDLGQRHDPCMSVGAEKPRPARLAVNLSKPCPLNAMNSFCIPCGRGLASTVTRRASQPRLDDRYHTGGSEPGCSSGSAMGHDVEHSGILAPAGGG